MTEAPKNGINSAPATTRSHQGASYRWPMRGELRVHLGAAPGAGKTHAALDEARRRRGRGASVVVAAIATPERGTLPDLLADVPTVATRSDGSLDVDAIAALDPDVVVVDDLAHAGRTTTRWREVDRLLDLGFDVITTLNIAEV